jgi:hypothetical protein
MVFLIFFAISLIGMLVALLIVRAPGGTVRGFWIGIGALCLMTVAIVVALIVSPSLYQSLMSLG